MKNIITTIVFATWLVACAQNQTNGSAETADEATANALPALKKECSYERTTRAGSRLHRVCRYVDTAQTGDDQ